jgi:hypothetical protein
MNTFAAQQIECSVVGGGMSDIGISHKFTTGTKVTFTTDGIDVDGICMGKISFDEKNDDYSTSLDIEDCTKYVSTKEGIVAEGYNNMGSGEDDYHGMIKISLKYSAKKGTLKYKEIFFPFLRLPHKYYELMGNNCKIVE